MTQQQLNQFFKHLRIQTNAIPKDSEQADTSETVYVSSLALLKMLKHARAGVPIEVMGLMLGEFADDFTVNVVDVFAMPQSGTGVTVEAVDPAFQAQMLELLKQTGRSESVVGWYHSHPGFGCWMSGVDLNTQKSFEALTNRAVAVVIDPIQSVRGKVVIDAFRTIGQPSKLPSVDARQTTSHLGHLHKPSIQALVHGLNRYYYSIRVAFKVNESEEKMLKSMSKLAWMDAIRVEDYAESGERNKEHLEKMVGLAKEYKKIVEEQASGLSKEELEKKSIGRVNAKRRIAEEADHLLKDNILQNMAGVIGTTSFQ